MPLSVLIVDESPAMRQMIQRSLAISNLTFEKYFAAQNGHAALGILSRARVDLILTEIHMTDMNGKTLAAKLRQSENLKSIPFLVISADRTASSVQQMLDWGAAGFLAKPFTPALLRSAVAEALSFKA